MSMAERDEFMARQDLLVTREAIDMAKLFRFSVRWDSSTYFCNQINEHVEGDRTRVTLDDVWIYDCLLPIRLVPHMELVAREYDIITLPDVS